MTAQTQPLSTQERLEAAATLCNAKQYAQESERFIFCIDLLEMSAHSNAAEDTVNALEDRFEALLDEAGIAFE